MIYSTNIWTYSRKTSKLWNISIHHKKGSKEYLHLENSKLPLTFVTYHFVENVDVKISNPFRYLDVELNCSILLAWLLSDRDFWSLLHKNIKINLQ